MTGPETPLTMNQVLTLSAIALLALADNLEEQNKDSISVRELREQASSEIAYLKDHLIE